MTAESQRVVRLGCGRAIGLGKYVAAWKACKSLPPETWIGRGISGYGETSETALAELRRGLHDRINRHDSAYGRGRKWSDQWQGEMYRAASQLNYPRLVIHWLPADLMRVPRFRERVESARADY